MIAYSAQPWNVANREYFALADEVLDKNRAEYVDFKQTVDDLLLRRASVGYFIAKMNGVLGDQAALAPKAVPKALRAFKTSSTDGLQRYLSDKVPDTKQVQRVVAIIGVGVKVIRMIQTGV